MDSEFAPVDVPCLSPFFQRLEAPPPRFPDLSSASQEDAGAEAALQATASAGSGGGGSGGLDVAQAGLILQLQR